MDPFERASCGESEKFRLRGLRGHSPSIATNSNDASSCMDSWGDSGEFGCGVRNVVRTGPTWCGVGCRPPVASVRSVPMAPGGFAPGQGMLEPGVCSRGLLRTCPLSGGGGGDASEGKGPERRPQRRLDERLEEVAEALGGGYCRSKMPLKLVLAVTELCRAMYYQNG